MDPKAEIEIRKQLEEKLGVEFCTSEELQQEIDKAEQEVKNDEVTIPLPPVVKRHEIQTHEIIEQCNAAMSRMSNTNPHKHLIYLCATAISQLTTRLAQREKELARYKDLSVKES